MSDLFPEDTKRDCEYREVCNQLGVTALEKYFMTLSKNPVALSLVGQIEKYLDYRDPQLFQALELDLSNIRKVNMARLWFEQYRKRITPFVQIIEEAMRKESQSPKERIESAVQKYSAKSDKRT